MFNRLGFARLSSETHRLLRLGSAELGQQLDRLHEAKVGKGLPGALPELCPWRTASTDALFKLASPRNHSSLPAPGWLLYSRLLEVALAVAETLNEQAAIRDFRALRSHRPCPTVVPPEVYREVTRIVGVLFGEDQVVFTALLGRVQGRMKTHRA